MARPVIVVEAALADGVRGVAALTDDDTGDAHLDAIRRRGGLVLMRRPVADADERTLIRARALGAAVALLPDDAGMAAWVVGAAARWRRDDVTATVQRVEAVISVSRGLAATDCGLPDVGPTSLAARWAARAWRPCAWCGGGGVRRLGCARCDGRIGANR